MNSFLSVTSISVVQSFWNAAQSMAVPQPCSAQHYWQRFTLFFKCSDVFIATADVPAVIHNNNLLINIDVSEFEIV